MRCSSRCLLVLATLLFCVLPAAADEVVNEVVDEIPVAIDPQGVDVAPGADAIPAVEEIPSTESSTGADGAWQPPAPSATSKDWVRMSSGEWLRGSIERIHDGDLLFDSDDLDDLTLDWGDIAEIRSPRRHTYRFEGRKIVTGTMAMKNGVIRIDTGTGVQSFERKKLVAMQEGEPKEINYWSFKAGLGFLARSGNTDQSDLTADARIIRRTPLTRTYLDYRGAFSTFDGSETANNHRLVTGFDLYLTRRFFLQIPVLELYYDPFVNIDLRATPGFGVGYDVFANKIVTWEVGGGAAYQYTRFTSTQPGAKKDSSDLAIVGSTSVDVDLTSYIEWDTDYKIAMVATDFDQSNMHLTTVISVDIWGPLDLDTTFDWDWVNQPTARADGSIPVSNDLRISIGLGLDF
jgi:putative salt-induced outer membrane protein YdiY